MPPTVTDLADEVYRDYVTVGVPESGAFNPPKSGIRDIFTRVQEIIAEDTTFIVGPTQDYTEPGELSEYLASRRIGLGVTVTVSIEDGTYTITKPWLGHVDGHRIVVINSGMNGVALVGTDFASLDAMWVIDSVTGVDSTSRATAKAAAEVILRAKYNVIFEIASGIGMTAGGFHAGDWSAAPCLWIATTEDATVGIMTGTGINSAIGDGAGGVTVTPYHAFHGFSNACVMTDYGGIINAANAVFSFCDSECTRTDFVGVIYATDCIIIGAGTYGYRANHGGSAWIDGCYVRGCATGIQIDNSPGMARIHGCDIQFNYNGALAQYGGSLKAAFGALSLGATLTSSGDGTTATVTFASTDTVAIGKTVSIIGHEPISYAGQHAITASSPGSVSFLDNATGAMTVAGTMFLILPSIIKNNARTQVNLNLGGDFDGRSLDMNSTELFPSNGGADAVPVFGLTISVGGTAVLDNTTSGTVSGHGRDLYMEGGTVSALGITFTNPQGPSGIVLAPDGNGIYSVYRPVYRGPQTKTADFTLAAYEKSIINNKSSGCVMTLPDAATCHGREVYVVNTTAQTLTSASSNVVPKGGGAAGTAVLPATSGAWAILVAQSTGTWKIMASG